MDQQPQNNPLTPPPAPPVPARWSAADTWLGLALLLVIVAGYLFALSRFDPSQNLSMVFVATFEFILLIPIAIIFFWRKIPLVDLGLRRFHRNSFAMGCGLLAIVYIVTIINNLVMIALKVVVQAEVLSEIFNELDSPLLFAFVTVIAAPLTEELFFRGFLFKGLREKYGWVNALMFSSIIFALFHGQVATLIPTFLLGALFAYLYQRTESVYPGMILHFIVNAMGVVGLLAAKQMGAL